MNLNMFKLKFVWLVFFLTVAPFFSYAQIILTIEGALELAEENYPSLKNSKLSFERTQLLLEAQRAGLKSQFSMSVDPIGYSINRRFDERYSDWYTSNTLSSGGSFQVEQPILFTDGTIRLTNRLNWQTVDTKIGDKTTSNERFQNSLSLRYNQPLFTYNRRKMELERLEFDHENSGISYALQRLNMESRITSQFFQVYMAQNNFAISREEFENAKTNFEIIKDKVNLDISPREELYQAQLNLASSESSFESSAVSLENAKDGFKQTLGISLSEDINVVANIVVNPMIVDPVKAIETALSSRMELRQREISLELAEMSLITTKAQNEFRGDLSVSLGITGDDPNFGNIYGDNNTIFTPSIMVSFNVPIFDWGQKKARIKAQETSIKMSELDFENSKIDIELNIRQTIRSLNNLRLQIGIAEQNVENAQRTYELNQIRYREGELTGLQMSQYQVQLSNARTSYVRAQINYKTELLSLKILTLYDFENEKAIVPVRELKNKN